MSDELDLSGKADPEREAPKQDKKKGGAEQVYTRPDRAERAWERDMRGRMERTLTRLQEWLEGRGDTELATILKEDGPAMIGGMIFPMRSAMWLRAPVVTVLTIVEPLLAFGRLFRTLLGRLSARREAAAEEYDRQAAEQAQADEAEAARQAGGFEG